MSLWVEWVVGGSDMRDLGDLWPENITCHPHRANIQRQTLLFWVLKGCHQAPQVSHQSPDLSTEPLGFPIILKINRRCLPAAFHVIPSSLALQLHTYLHLTPETFLIPPPAF